MSSPSPPTEEPQVQDVAMSLCALGRSRSPSPDSRDDAVKAGGGTSSRDVDVTAPGGGSASAPSSLPADMDVDDRLKAPDLPPLPPLAAGGPSSQGAAKGKKKAPPKKAKAGSAAASPKYNMKPKDPKRDTSVPFDEMKRLMRVYGSLKCLRNRTPVDSGRTAKVESIKRK